MLQSLLTLFHKIREIVFFSTNGMMTDENIFYKNAKIYWSNVPATLDGVLGGFGHISDIDIEGSKSFMNDVLFLENPPKTGQALDCGAGIGRVTQNLLMPLCERVDLVEQDEKFAKAAMEAIGKANKKLGKIYQMGLQDFHPDKKYDIIWCQWVLGHLNDDDMCAFMVRCREALNENGVIIVKENITADEDLEYDEEDSSVTRPYLLLMKIFQIAKLKVVHSKLQEGFPDDIYDVYMFALAPETHLDRDWDD